MKVWEIQGSFGLENLRETERPDPPPLTGKQVLVQIKAVSLNYRDLLMVTGVYNPRQKLPLVPCSDGAGVVVDVGSEVKEWKVGDRVLPIFAQAWQSGTPGIDELRSTLGGPLDGCLAEYLVADETGLVGLPEHLSFQEGACLPCAGLTAYNAVIQHGNAKSGDTVVCLGTGGVSLFALQFAKSLGCRVILTSSQDEKLERGKVLGADFTINYKSRTNWERDVRKFTGLKGADLLVEVVGAGTLPKSMIAVRPFGTIALVGVLAGGESNLSLYPILMQGIRVQGIIVGSRSDFFEMNQTITKHMLHPVISSVFSWKEAPQAFTHLQSGSHFGKVVLEC